MSMHKLSILILPVFCLCLVFGAPGWAQEMPEAEEEKASDWIWGEVVSVDPQKQEVVIKHLDYETYEEIQTVLKTDEKTAFENAEGLGGINPQDRITADYHLEAGSKVAELVVLEKEEIAAEPGAPEGETAP